MILAIKQRWHIALHVGALLAMTATTVAAQERGKRTSSTDVWTATERERGTLHPGDPLRVVGLDEGGDAFLAATPALRTTNGHVEFVDTSELYERRMAMLTGGRVFTRPPRAAAPAAAYGARLAEPDHSERATPSADEGGAEREAHDSYAIPTWLAVVLGGCVTALGIGTVLKR